MWENPVFVTKPNQQILQKDVHVQSRYMDCGLADRIGRFKLCFYSHIFVINPVSILYYCIA